jgi:hypothetical protein
MSQNQDIRDWAIAQGISVNLKGPVPKEVKERWAGRDGEAPAEGVPVSNVKSDIPDQSTEPKPEGKAKQPWWKGQAKPKNTGPGHRRVSLENLITTAWGLAGKFLPVSATPVARVLEMQAPVAGIVVDEMARGTAADAILQPFARAGEKGEKAMALIGPPLLVGAVCSNPKLYPVVRPMLKTSIMLWMEVSEPAMKKAQQRAKRFEEKFGGADVDAMIDALFAPPEGFEQQPDGSWTAAVQEPVAA